MFVPFPNVSDVTLNSTEHGAGDAASNDMSLAVSERPAIEYWGCGCPGCWHSALNFTFGEGANSSVEGNVSVKRTPFACVFGNDMVGCTLSVMWTMEMAPDDIWCGTKTLFMLMVVVEKRTLFWPPFEFVPPFWLLV